MVKRLGVIVPMSTEAGFVFGFKHWHRLNNLTIKTHSTRSGLQLLCVRSGIGPGNAAAAAHWLIDQGVTALAVLGVAGALNPSLGIGDLVIPEIVCQAGEKSNQENPGVAASIAESLCRRLTSEGFNVHRGLLLTSEDPVLTPHDKSSLLKRFGAHAVDMETAAVFRTALDHQLPFLSIRSIGDRATTDIPIELYQSLRAKGTLSKRRLLSALWENPYLTHRILCIGLDFFRALMVLKSAWQLLLKNNGIFSISKEKPACGSR